MLDASHDAIIDLRSVRVCESIFALLTIAGDSLTFLKGNDNSTDSFLHITATTHVSYAKSLQETQFLLTKKGKL
jgi:hypothetical protein